MFGTIGHGRLKNGHDADFEAMFSEWRTSIRPLVPGTFIELAGHRADDSREIVFVALAQDEATYRALAELPEQDAFYRQMVEHLEAEPSWEDVELEVVVPE